MERSIASVSINDELELSIHVIKNGCIVTVQLPRIAAQQLANAIMHHAGGKFLEDTNPQRRTMLGAKVIEAPDIDGIAKQARREAVTQAVSTFTSRQLRR